jgi:hypothetical protein
MMTESFSPWCVRCLEGDYSLGPAGSHQAHKLVTPEPKEPLEWEVRYREGKPDFSDYPGGGEY